MQRPAVDDRAGTDLEGPELEAFVHRRIAAALAAAPARRRPAYAAAKRVLDIAVAAALLALTAPVIAVVAVVIRVESPGPAVFRQRRVVRSGRVVWFYKFRTMYADARERHAELYEHRFGAAGFAGSYYKPADDPRNTPFGRALRRTTLDELPNLVNVLRGEVSLVGPRPELPGLVAFYTPDQLAKFSVKAGITGLAQVSGRNNLTIGEQIEADLEYVRRRSFTYDLWLLARTAWSVVARVGAA
jgi:lipopolysaccharide/colanic/teichoic acid biosynthesis glycosyltransferase